MYSRFFPEIFQLPIQRWECNKWTCLKDFISVYFGTYNKFSIREDVSMLIDVIFLWLVYFSNVPSEPNYKKIQVHTFLTLNQIKKCKSRILWLKLYFFY